MRLFTSAVSRLVGPQAALPRAPRGRPQEAQVSSSPDGHAVRSLPLAAPLCDFRSESHEGPDLQEL